MKKRHLLIVLFGILACVLIMDDLVPEPLIGHDSNSVYALGRHPPKPKGPKQTPNPGTPQPVPEPSTLFLLGTGAAGIAGYLYYKNRKNKK